MSEKQKSQTFRAVKGTRDFYPDEMRVRNWIADAWRRVSLRNGFEEYDAPIFEYLDLFTVKSGEEIAEQLFHFTDRGGRDLAIRPEITPSLARMVAAKINALPRPIKWFSIPRLCRAERPQRGRLREFFQWNIDVIGVDSVQADVECIYTCIDFLREVGLTPADVKLHVGSRPLVISLLSGRGVSEANLDAALLALDKRPKVPHEAFAEMCVKAGLADEAIDEICDILDTPSDRVIDRLLEMDGLEEQAADLRALSESLDAMGVGEYVTLDLHIVRGLAYYTGVVYEALAEGERAVAGGGRYDNLLQLVGGPAVGATGFGMGDVVLGLLLDEKGKLPAELRERSVEIFAVAGGEESVPAMLSAVGRLRQGGVSAEYSFKQTGVGKQLKEASKRGASRALIVHGDKAALKDLGSGEQTPDAPLDEVVQGILNE